MASTAADHVPTSAKAHNPNALLPRQEVMQVTIPKA